MDKDKVMRVVIVSVVSVAIVFFSFNYAFHSHPEMEAWIINVEYHPTNRGSVVIEGVPSVIIEGAMFTGRITGLFKDVNYSIWADPCMGIGPLANFTGITERVFWFQALLPDQQWGLCREYLNKTVLVARIYLT